MVKILYNYFPYFFGALILSLILVPLMSPLSFKLGAVDRGTGRRVHKGIIPRLGGIGIYFAFMIPLVFSLTRGVWGNSHNTMACILIASTAVFIIGVYDDIKGARVRYKLIVEILAASAIYAWGTRITVIGNPLGEAITLGWFSLPVTVLWIIIITNAINLIDGLDGLTAGTGILISISLFLLSGESDMHLQLALVTLIGSLLGFLRYNFPPASIFMGDSGSLFLGFFFSSISILSAQKAATAVTLTITFAVFGFPLMDMLYAVLRRYYRGLPLGKADKEHIHHKLLEKGLSKKKVILLLYSLNIIFLIGVLLFIKGRSNSNLVCLFLFLVTAIVGLRMFGYIEFISIFKEIIRNYSIYKKRKFFNYVIKRFRYNASKSKSIEDFKFHLRELMKEYNFNFVEVSLDIPGIKNPFFYFNSKPIANKPISLFFFIVHKENHLGKVSLIKEVNEAYSLLVPEIVNALSEEIGGFVERNNIRPTSRFAHNK